MSQQPKSFSSSQTMEQEVNEGELTDSWVTFNMNVTDNVDRNSAMHEMEKLLYEAQRESGASSIAGSKSSSSHPSTPCNSLQSTPALSGQTSPRNPQNSEPLKEVIPKLLSKSQDTDWVWDWSSTPDTRPPKKTQFKRPSRSSALSMRKSSVMKNGIFSWEFLQVFIPSLIVTNLLAFGFGIYVGKRLGSSTKTA